MWGQYYGILARGPYKNDASLGPYENDQGPIFPSTAPASYSSLVSSLLYGTRAMLVLNLLAFEYKKYTANDRMETVQWQNPDQERTNQNTRIYTAI